MASNIPYYIRKEIEKKWLYNLGQCPICGKNIKIRIKTLGYSRGVCAQDTFICKCNCGQIWKVQRQWWGKNFYIKENPDEITFLKPGEEKSYHFKFPLKEYEEYKTINVDENFNPGKTLEDENQEIAINDSHYGKCEKCGYEIYNETNSLERIHLDNNCMGKIDYLKKCKHNNVEYINYGEGFIPGTGARVTVDRLKCLDCGIEPTKYLWTGNITELWKYMKERANIWINTMYKNKTS